MKKTILLSLMVLLISKHTFAQGAFGTIPVTNTGPNIIVHDYTYKSSYRVVNLAAKKLQVFVSIFEDKNATPLCTKSPILVRDGDKFSEECGDKSITLKLYKGMLGGTWLDIDVGTKDDDDNLLAVESKVTIDWKETSDRESSSTNIEPRHKD